MFFLIFIAYYLIFILLYLIILKIVLKVLNLKMENLRKRANDIWVLSAASLSVIPAIKIVANYNAEMIIGIAWILGWLTCMMIIPLWIED